VRDAAVAVLRRPFEAALELPPQLRRRLLVVLAGLVLLLSLYLFWFRDSGFVAVERVSITGLTTSDSARLRQALTDTAQDMTTLHVDRGRLERIAATYPVVDRLEISPDFPHGLRIEVIQHVPAAILISGRSRVAVSGEGTVLRGLPTSSAALPEVALGGALPDERLAPGAALRAVGVAGAAPAPLRRRLTSVRDTRDRGLVARMRRGPEIVFGDPTRLQAKWAAAARVLADRGSRGASYIDVRLPDRPAAGGLPVNTLVPIAPAGDTTLPQGAAPTQPQAPAPAGQTGTPDGGPNSQP
jgi:cell division protein FtsQ